MGIFVIIGQTVMHFGISQKYEKYTKLVISFMVMAQIIFTFSVYLKNDNDSWQILSAREYLEKWDINMKEVEDRMEKNREEILLRLEEEVSRSGANAISDEGLQNNSIIIEKIVVDINANAATIQDEFCTI